MIIIRSINGIHERQVKETSGFGIFHININVFALIFVFLYLFAFAFSLFTVGLFIFKKEKSCFLRNY